MLWVATYSWISCLKLCVSNFDLKDFGKEIRLIRFNLFFFYADYFSFAAITSLIGSSEIEILIVLPIPFSSKRDNPIELFTIDGIRGPASVIPR